jgi:hypothetical protein
VAGVWQGWWRVGPEGLTDARGRVLGLDRGALRLGGPERDVDAVLDALEAGADTAPSEEPAPSEQPARPEAEAAPRDGQADASTSKPSAPLDRADAEPGVLDGPGEARAEAADPIRLRLAAPEDEELRAALRAAAQAWRDAGAELRLELDAEAADAVRIGPDAWFGPDALALSRRTPGADGIEILLRPGPQGRRPDVLARELGLLAGLPAGATPLASGLLPVGEPAAVRADDARALMRTLEGPAADLTGDGAVDLYDLAALAEAYGQVGTRLPADLDRSGRVDDADVELLREAYEFLPASRDAPPDRRPTEP